MAQNPYQKIGVLDINAQTEATLNNYLSQGYVIQFIVNLSALNKLLIVYCEPGFDVP
jgi:hypothetical protein